MNPIERFFCRRKIDVDLASEMASHIEEKTHVLMADGMSEEEAREQVRRAFGNITALQEQSREAWGWNAFEDLCRDLRYAVRVLLKTPAFTFTAITVLALGIGMNTAIFSAVKAVLLSRLPYSEPERLMDLRQTARDGHTMQASGPDARDWIAQSKSFEAVAMYGADTAAVAGDFAPREENLAVVSAGFLRTFNIQPYSGRGFDKQESRSGGRRAALISYRLASELFGTASAALNRVFRMNSMPFLVIGILPPGFDFPERAQVWISQEAFADNNERSAHNYRVIGRLKADVTRSQAQADMDVIAARLARAYADDKDEGIRVTSLYDQLVGPFRPAFTVLFGAVCAVLLIACANISNLQLARATTRIREMALRTALGAARTRLIRQLLTESLLLAVCGGCLGVCLAIAGCSLLRHYAPADIPRIETIHIDGGVLLFSMVLTLGAGILFGLLPALTASRADVNEALKEGAGKATSGSQVRSRSSVLVVAEIGLAVILLSGAALLLRSLWKLNHVQSGLRSSEVFAADIKWPDSSGSEGVDAAAISRAASQILNATGSLPGLQAAGFINALPIRDPGADGSFEIEDVPMPADPHDAPDAWYRSATAGYFKALGMPILLGRNFTEADDRSSTQVALVNQAFARIFLKKGGILGRHIRFFGFDRKPQFMTVIGVVPDVHAFGLNKPSGPEVFADYLQHTGSHLDVNLVVQAQPATQSAIRDIIRKANHDTPINFQWMDDVISASLSREHFEAACLSIFAGFALLLAAVGIYGLLSYTVSSRSGEIGIRMALGARQADVLGLILREGLILAAIGLAAGLLGALFCTRALASFLFGTTPSDPTAFCGIAAVFILTALLSCYIPARRAARIDPNEALRYQ